MKRSYWMCPFCPKSKAPTEDLRVWGSALDTALARIQTHLLTHVIEELRTAGRVKKKRAPTAYQRFIGKKMKKGASVLEALADWRNRAVPS